MIFRVNRTSESTEDEQKQQDIDEEEEKKYAVQHCAIVVCVLNSFVFVHFFCLNKSFLYINAVFSRELNSK